MSELRQKGYSDVSKIAYAILEENGKMSVFPTADSSPATPSDLGLKVAESGIAHVCIIDGAPIKANLDQISWSTERLHNELKKRKIVMDDVFLMTVDDAGGVNIILKERKK